MNGSVKGINGNMIRPTVFEAPETGSATLADSALIEAKGMAVGVAVRTPAESTQVSINSDDLLERLRCLVEDSRLDLRHCNLAYAMTMLVNNSAAVNGDRAIIVKEYDEIVSNEAQKAKAEDVEHDPVVMQTKIDIDDLDKQIKRETDPKRKRELEAQQQQRIVDLQNRLDELQAIAKECEAKIAASQVRIGNAFAHLDQGQMRELAVAIATITGVAKWRALSAASEAAAEAKATLDGAESLAVCLDKCSPGFRKMCESFEQQIDYMLHRRINYM